MRRRQVWAEQEKALMASPTLEAELKAPLIMESLGVSPFSEDVEERVVIKARSCPKCGKPIGKGGHFHVKACKG